MARTMKVGIGSIITFDVLGRKINATVTSIRKIDVRNTRTVFMFVFVPERLILRRKPLLYQLLTRFHH